MNLASGSVEVMSSLEIFRSGLLIVSEGHEVRIAKRLAIKKDIRSFNFQSNEHPAKFKFLSFFLCKVVDKIHLFESDSSCYQTESERRHLSIVYKL